MKIGVFGLTFAGGNKGCSALGYSFLEILRMICKDTKNDILVFTYLEHEEIRFFDDMNIKIIPFLLNSIESIKKLKKEIKQCDIIFDFTEGDSFTDIYGIKRAIKVSLTKQLVLINKVPLVLGPQTYGPFNSWIMKKWAKHIIKKSYYSCTRDEKSAERMKELTGMLLDTYTDIAFALPKAKEELHLGKRPKIGINVSGLLWHGGYTQDNQFGLALEYKEYIRGVIERILEEGKYEIHLIPHVISAVYERLENDYKICNELAEQYEGLKVAPPFETPMEAKQYISKMDIFMGARMHATIGAFSLGVVTIPFSYSPKFEGLYESVDYKYVIHGNTMDIDTAISTTMSYIHQSDMLAKAGERSVKLIDKRLKEFYIKVKKLLNECKS